jgi:hypothetical protein
MIIQRRSPRKYVLPLSRITPISEEPTTNANQNCRRQGELWREINKMEEVMIHPKQIRKKKLPRR